MDPIAKTAYYCCGVRAADARRDKPLCGDHLAERFMDADARAVFERFAGFRMPNASNAARHRIIDERLRELLQEKPETLVVLLGAGFDTRAFRLAGGRWVELDQPSLIALKDQKLPAAEAPNTLQRVPIDFAQDDLSAKLAPWAGTQPTVVVMEGVTMYLSADDLGATLRTLQTQLPKHRLICDLMTRAFMTRQSAGLRKEIQKLGGDFAPAQDDPAGFVESLGYRRIAAHSVVGRAVQLGAIRIPRWLLNTFLRSVRDGYRVFEFEAV